MTAGDWARMVLADFFRARSRARVPRCPAWAGVIAPTLDPEELDKRIGELRTVQFWLNRTRACWRPRSRPWEVQRRR